METGLVGIVESSLKSAKIMHLADSVLSFLGQVNTKFLLMHQTLKRNLQKPQFKTQDKGTYFYHSSNSETLHKTY